MRAAGRARLAVRSGATLVTIDGRSSCLPTTHSFELGNFPLCAKSSRTGGLRRRCLISAKTRFWRGRDFGRVVSGTEIRLPGNGDRVRQRRGSNERRLRSEAKHQMLARPFSRHIAQPDNSHSMWKPSINGQGRQAALILGRPATNRYLRAHKQS